MISSIEILLIQHWTVSRSVETFLIYEYNFAVSRQSSFLWDSFTPNLGHVGQQINSKVHKWGKIFNRSILRDRSECVRKVTKID